jgi:PHP family Zn ribbon phosphoesterase
VSKDAKYSIEIMQQELNNQFISPEIKHAFQTSIEALETQTPKKVKYAGASSRCPECMETALRYYDYCPDCGQKLDWGAGPDDD